MEHAASPSMFAGIGLVYLLVLVLFIVAGWKIYAKAGQPGWVALIPIYNLVVFLRIVGRPIWWILLFIIPLVNVVVTCVLANDLSKKFGKGVGFTIGLILLTPIFYLILAFGDAKYQG